MAELHLIIGNKNYSSWSLRPWMLLRHLGLPFRETLIVLDRPETKQTIARYGAGRVPILRDGELVIWDSLAICEYVAEKAGCGWPAEAAARGVARSACAEMHSSFASLRREWPMNARASNRKTPMTAELQADIARIDDIWADCRARFGQEGPWLFGEFTVADAMYAPVVLRFNTYGARLSEGSRAYLASALKDPALKQWVDDASREEWVIAREELG